MDEIWKWKKNNNKKNNYSKINWFSFVICITNLWFFCKTQKKIFWRMILF